MRPKMVEHKLTQFNMVEAMWGGLEDDEKEDCAFDQPCIYGHRTGGHSVYCHHPDGIARKCYYRWCSQKDHEANKCGGYKPNPAYDPNGPQGEGWRKPINPS